MGVKTLKEIDFRVLLTLTFIMLVVAVMTASMTFLLLTATDEKDCFMETGVMSDYWTDSTSLWIQYIEGNKTKTVWFKNDLGEHLDFRVSGVPQIINLRWCYISSIDEYRVRGIWLM